MLFACSVVCVFSVFDLVFRPVLRSRHDRRSDAFSSAIRTRLLRAERALLPIVSSSCMHERTGYIIYKVSIPLKPIEPIEITYGLRVIFFFFLKGYSLEVKKESSGKKKEKERKLVVYSRARFNWICLGNSDGVLYNYYNWISNMVWRHCAAPVVYCKLML